ncbi:hypothetical protein GCM10028775_29420 [Catellatospora paridis]
MTFRIRVFALVAVVVLLAAGASTYLTFTLAENAVTASATAQQQVMRQIAEEVTRYGRDHGTWEGMAEVAAGIARRTGRRIRLDTQDGAIGVVDTAVLAGQPVTPMTKLTFPIDARPQLDLPRAAGQEREITLQAIEEYRQEIRFAACLSRAGMQPQAVTTHYGLPLITHTIAPPDLVTECRTGTASQPRSITRDQEEVGRCFDTPAEKPAPGSRSAAPRALAPDPAQHLRTCLGEVFLTRIGIVGPEPLRLAVSSEDGIDTTPIMLAFSVVAVPIALGSLLLSRHVLRPIQRLTVATRRFGEGSLDQRVDVEGGDELAQLAVTFNGMADSLQHAEEQQRRMIADIAHELRTPAGQRARLPRGAGGRPGQRRRDAVPFAARGDHAPAADHRRPADAGPGRGGRARVRPGRGRRPRTAGELPGGAPARSRGRHRRTRGGRRTGAARPRRRGPAAAGGGQPGDQRGPTRAGGHDGHAGGPAGRA